MFGELDDSDIYEENQGTGFGGSSDSDFSEYDGFADESEEITSFNSNANFEQSGVLGASYGGEKISAGPQKSDEIFAGAPVAPSQGEAPQQPKRKVNSALIYVLILAVLFSAAIGMFFFKQNANQSAPPDEQAMGDYFYDQAAGTKPDAAAPATAEAGTAMVEVDLNGGNAQTAAQMPDAPQSPSASPAAMTPEAKVAAKPMTALDKALTKQKADAAKENSLGLGNSVTVSVAGAGRVDPFMPYTHHDSTVNRPRFDLIAPPLEIPVEDPVVDELMATKISGIMYDKIRPSAIVNFGASDQLVHVGDTVKGFKIAGITKNSVVIKYGTNVYQATVGQTLNEGINLNPVSSVAKQFGGAYVKTPKNVIQFNN